MGREATIQSGKTRGHVLEKRNTGADKTGRSSQAISLLMSSFLEFTQEKETENSLSNFSRRRFRKREG